MKHRIFIMFLLILLALFSGCTSNQKEIEFNKSEWEDFDAGFYSESRYAMALWLIDNYDFLGKTKEEIWDKLCSERAGGFDKDKYFAADSISFTIKQGEPDDGYVPEMAYLRLEFADNAVTKVIIGERKSLEEDFTIRVECDR